MLVSRMRQLSSVFHQRVTAGWFLGLLQKTIDWPGNFYTIDLSAAEPTVCISVG